MSALAQVLCSRGYIVRGSDRAYDEGRDRELFKCLAGQGILLYPQTGEGVVPELDELIVSSAVEPRIPDVQRAIELHIPIVKRAELLARLFNSARGIAVGGTSGKSTVTGMIGHILQCNGANPTIINGGIMLNVSDGNVLGNGVSGSSESIVIEADESDGTISHYLPDVAVLTNISRDHKTLEDLHLLFEEFCCNARSAAVINIDCEEAAKHIDSDRRSVTFGIERDDADVLATMVRSEPWGSSFAVDDIPFRLGIPGRYNVSNAVAAIAACGLYDVSLSGCAEALATFKGIGRRMQVVGEAGGVTVVDDFAHNPDKVTAALSTLKAMKRRLFVIFQPHGFAPTLFAKDGFISAFSSCLGAGDVLVMPEIYYAGGTTEKKISSKDLINAIAAAGIDAHFVPNRREILDMVMRTVKPEGMIVIMGARDNSLTEYARVLLHHLDGK